MLVRAYQGNRFLTNALGFLALAVLVSTAVSVHPQNAPSGATSGAAAQGSQSQPGAVNRGNQSAGQSSGASGKSGNSSDSGTAAGTAGGSSAAAGGKASGTLSAADRKMVRDLAAANLAEIETAKLAQSKASSDQVRSFAQKMIDDHTKAQDQVQQLAQAKGVQLPTAPDAKHQAAMKKLSALSGNAFDRQYMSKAGLSDHREAHRLVARISSRAHDADVKALGTTLLPTIDQHLQMAQQMQGKGSQQGDHQTSSGK
jgi:putative membrane protein